jgi:hypothetical protein
MLKKGKRKNKLFVPIKKIRFSTPKQYNRQIYIWSPKSCSWNEFIKQREKTQENLSPEQVILLTKDARTHSLLLIVDSESINIK